MRTINSVILIDDDRIFNLINEQTIHSSNFAIRVKAYTNAEVSLKELNDILQNNPEDFPEVIFLDINMPVMDGWQFLEKYKQLPADKIKNCKVYILTSSIDPNDMEKSRTYASVKDFITKPLTVEKLNKLRESLEGNSN